MVLLCDKFSIYTVSMVVPNIDLPMFDSVETSYA
jgi:hypothetical protein